MNDKLNEAEKFNSKRLSAAQKNIIADIRFGMIIFRELSASRNCYYTDKALSFLRYVSKQSIDKLEEFGLISFVDFGFGKKKIILTDLGKTIGL